MQKTIKKYREHLKKDGQCNPGVDQLHTQQLKHEAAIIQPKLEQLEASQRKLLGQVLSSISLDELSELDSKLEHALRSIRARKAQLFKEQVEKLKAKERYLLEEYAELCQKNTSLCEKQRERYYLMKQKDPVTFSQSCQFSEVETELFVGLRLSQNGRDM
ncbi:hypothetical protein L6452_05093 [Arctium lappa]|uniref:Uncharacterized protein n=1 Tax=Arctium lappa TaxID=4217 RepID=A0ACB9EEV5_ARCLA|nr:hypothetical protein L6452_05093 [Arctium lappa]